MPRVSSIYFWNQLALLVAAFSLCFGIASGGILTAQEKTDAQEKPVDNGPVWATLKGRILVEGDIPASPNEAVDKDQGICVVDGQMPKDDNLIVSDEGGLRDMFVMMYLKDDEKIPVHPQYENPDAKPLLLDNVRCRFEPHAMFVRTGQKLLLKNSDEVGHNCHIITFGNEENINLAQLSEVEVKFNNSDKVPGNVVCDIHKWMDAVILVRDEPYVGISGKDGTFEISNVPAGTWSFQFWHKKGGYLRDLKIEGYEPGRRGEIEITVTDGEVLDLGEMKISIDALNK